MLERMAYVLLVDDATLRGGGDTVGQELLHRSAGKIMYRFPLTSLCPGQAKPPAGSTSTKRPEPLVLIHIPRTGGTSIEDCSKDEMDDNDRWGSRNTQIHQKIGMGGVQGKCWGQHVPPSMAPVLEPVFSSGETFCVVRHPADRLISEYGFMQSWTKRENQRCDAETMNGKLVEWMRKVKGAVTNRSRPSPYYRDCHMIPQAAFVRGWDAATQAVIPSQQVCKHVLRFESLTKDFNKLMETKGFPYRLTEKKSMPSLASCSPLKKTALYQETKDLLRELYKDDFELLGYTMD